MVSAPLPAGWSVGTRAKHVTDIGRHCTFAPYDALNGGYDLCECPPGAEVSVQGIWDERGQHSLDFDVSYTRVESGGGPF